MRRTARGGEKRAGHAAVGLAAAGGYRKPLRPKRFGLLLGGLMCGLGLAGCGDEKPPAPALGTPAATAKPTGTKTAGTGRPSAGPTDIVAGFRLEIDTPLQTGTCVARLEKVSDRHNYLRLSTSADQASENFPSVLMFAQLLPDQPTALNGQQLLANVFFQRSPTDPVWQTIPGQLVTLRITRSDGASIQGEIVSGSLVDVAGGQQKAVVGKFSGIWQ